jgi:hypothetical protein
MAPRITIRIGAAYDEVIVDGHTFDRAGLDRGQRRAMAALIVESLFPGQPSRPKHRPRRPRKEPRK